MNVVYTKMTGIGNDYIYFDAINFDIPETAILEIIPALSKRRFGIGSDGVIFIKPSSNADAKMEMYNADGSRSEMCGNGLRCVVRYCLDNITKNGVTSIETDAGIAKGWKTDDNDICIEMFDHPKLQNQTEEVTASDQTFSFTRVDVGNPHAVIKHQNIDDIPLATWGPQIENNLALFPKRVNTEFYEEVLPGHVKMRVWERGSGETYACGTGAAAVAAVYRLSCQQNQIKVSLLGGDLVFDFKDGKFFMTGGATYVAEGSIELRDYEEK